MAAVYHTISIYPYPIVGLSAHYVDPESELTVVDCNDHYELQDLSDGLSVVISAPGYHSITKNIGTGDLWFGNLYAWYSVESPFSNLGKVLYTDTENPSLSSKIYNYNRWESTSSWQSRGTFTNISSTSITYVRNDITYTYTRYNCADIINKKPECLYPWTDNNITSMYAWTSSNKSASTSAELSITFYTLSPTPTVNDTIYDENGNDITSEFVHGAAFFNQASSTSMTWYTSEPT